VKKKHAPLTQQELVHALRNVPVFIQEKVMIAGHQVKGVSDGETIRIAKRFHRTEGLEMGLVSTLIHELIHHARPDASETWVRRQEPVWLRDQRVREEACFRLIREAYYGEVVRE
jgi:hypothetical protein